jgi:MFS family permease
MFMLMMPVIVLYFTELGLSMHDVMLVQALFGATMVAFEIPSGYFSDVLGRRRTMIIGATLTWSGWILYAFVHGIWGVLSAEIVLGIGFSLISGTDSALRYDTLLEMGHPERSMQEEGRQISMANFSESAAAIIGGLLAGVSLLTPLIVQAALFTALPVLAWLLTEPQVHMQRRRASVRDMWDIVHGATFRDPEIRMALIMGSIIAAATLTNVWMVQPIMASVGVPTAAFGVIWAVLNATAGMSSMNAWRLERRVGFRRNVLVLIGILAVGFTLTGLIHAWWIAVIFALFSMVRGLGNPLFISRINARVSSDQRATVLSIRQLGMRVIFLVMGPFIGWIADRTSLQTAQLISGGTFVGVALAAYVFLSAPREAYAGVASPSLEVEEI